MGGNTISIEYAVPVSERKPGETAVYRYPDFKDHLTDGPSENLKTMKDVVKNSFASFGPSNMLGRIIREDGKEYIDYLSYHQVKEVAIQVGSGICHEKLFYQAEGEDLKFVGIFSRNRPEWTILDVACILYGYVTIPIYDTLGD